jgi:NAD(P)-dependent dehydrogenase (short-subunit alcohol dehydrogenase family)
MREAVLSGPQMGRAAEPEEMVGTVLCLCSRMSSFATGQTLTIDGGQTAH